MPTNSLHKADTDGLYTGGLLQHGKAYQNPCLCHEGRRGRHRDEQLQEEGEMYIIGATSMVHRNVTTRMSKPKPVSPTTTVVHSETCTRTSTQRTALLSQFSQTREDNTARVMSLAQKHGPKLYTSHTFHGACVGSGAEVSPISFEQSKAYHRIMGLPMDVSPSTLSFKFGDFLYLSEGITTVRVPFTNGGFIAFRESCASRHSEDGRLGSSTKT